MLIEPQVCHAVDTRHDGSDNASVAYIGACPTTATNKAYSKAQLAAILGGRRPPDYVEEGPVLEERTLKGYVGLEGLSAEASKAWGFGL